MKQSKKAAKIKKLNRDSTIRMALKKIREIIDLRDCIIRVTADPSSVIALFRNPIIFLPPNSSYSYNFGINLVDDTVWSLTISNPENYETNEFDIPAFSLTKAIQKHIDFVLIVINKSDEIASVSIKDFSFDETMIIRDNDNYYRITMISPNLKSFYKINKNTGEIYDTRHIHLIPLPSANDNKDSEIIQ